MNRQKWLLGEAQKWKEEELITSQQYEQIVRRYEHVPKMNALPIFGSILLGLGVLTFIASNWQGLAALIKLLIILLSLSGAYATGEYLRRKGYERLGLTFTMLGITIYGAGFFLIGQMYQLSADPLMAFYLWAAGAIPLAWYYRSQAIVWMSMAILMISTFYGLDENTRDGLSILSYYLVFFAGIAPLVLRFRQVGMIICAGLLLMAQALVDGARWSEGVYAPVLFMLYYLLGQFVLAQPGGLAQVLQRISYLGIVIYSVLLILIEDFLPIGSGVDTTLAVLLLVMTVISAVIAVRRRMGETLPDLLPFATIGLLALLAPGLVWLDAAVIMMFCLALFSVGMVLGGERLREASRINLGAIAFGITCFVGYIHYAWDFMDKSLFFLIGGLLLLVLSFFGERARRRWVNDAKGDQQ